MHFGSFETNKIMENSTKEQGGGGGSGGPTEFLVKIYQMVDDPYTDNIVSWSQSNNSFIIKDPDEFATNLLSKYFRHNNFSNFVCQLNTYVRNIFFYYLNYYA